VAGCTADVSATQDAGVNGQQKDLKTAALFACRETCWNDIPYNTCGNQRDDCLSNAASNEDIAQCRKMSRTCRHQRRACLHNCNAIGNKPLVNKPTKSPYMMQSNSIFSPSTAAGGGDQN
jgi:hypothetical protein